MKVGVIIIYHVRVHANAGSCFRRSCLIGKNRDYYYVICEHKLHGWTIMLLGRLKWQAFNKCEVCLNQDTLVLKYICQLKQIWQQTWWRHQMVTSFALLALCASLSQVHSIPLLESSRIITFTLKSNLHCVRLCIGSTNCGWYIPVGNVNPYKALQMLQHRWLVQERCNGYSYYTLMDVPKY